MARTLIQKGADINATDNWGSTPLILASNDGNREMVKCLLKAGAKVNVANHAGQTALTVSLLEGHEKIASLLLKHGADVEEPLRYALRFRKTEMAGWLSKNMRELMRSGEGFIVLGDGVSIRQFKGMKEYIGGVYMDKPDEENFISLSEYPVFANRIYVQAEPQAKYLRFFLGHAHVKGLIEREVILYRLEEGRIKEQSHYGKSLCRRESKGYSMEMPRAIEVDPVNRCNLKCTMCHVSYMETPKLEMLDERVISHLSGIKDCFVQIGGSYEPTVNQYFPEMTRMFAQNGCELSLITNASLLTEGMINELSTMKFYSILVSMDSAVETTYEKIRRGGKYESVVRNIRRLREAFKGKDTIFLINMVIMRSNIDELKEMVDFAEEVGVDSLGFMNMVVRFDSEELMNESLDPVMDYAFRKLDEAAEYVIREKKKVIVTSSYYSYTPLKGRYPRNVKGGAVVSDHGQSRSYFNKYTASQLGKHPEMSNDCVSPFTFAKVQNDGDVNVCRDYIIGNVKESSLEEVWFGETAGYVRNFVMSNPVLCDTCEHYRYCLKPGTMDVYDPSNVGGKVDVARVEDHLSRMKLGGEDMENPPYPEFARFIGVVREGEMSEVRELVGRGVDKEARDANGNTALIHASLAGKREVVGYLVEQGADVNVTNKYADRPLTVALARGHREVAEVLVSNGADINAALIYATIHHQKSVVEYLLEQGADINVKDEEGRTPLANAITSNSKEMAGYFISKGADVNMRDVDGLAPLTHAVICNHSELAELLISAEADVNAEDNNGSSPLVHASLNGNNEMVRRFLASGADINQANKAGERPLTVALLQGHLNVAELIISSGADLGVVLRNAVVHHQRGVAEYLIDHGVDVNARDEGGRTLLATAVACNDIAMAEYLVSRWADIELRDKNGLTPLIIAAISNHGEMSEVLISAGADIEASDANGSTALIHAALNDHNEIVRKLVLRGANVNMKNKYLESPVSIALSRGNHEVADYLAGCIQK